MTSLGKTGIAVLPVGLGTWSWGDREDWGFGRTHDEEDVRDAFSASTSRGPILVDTAERYGGGDSERLVGRLARDLARPVVVATKFSPTRWQIGRADLFRALRGSLQRLGRDRIDLYQLHWPTGLSSIAGRMAAMADAVEEGLVRAVGVANFSASQVLRADDALVRRRLHLSSVQVEYSLLHREPERNGLIAACEERGITVLAYSPLAGGVLSGKYGPGNPPPGTRGVRYTPEVLRRVAGLLEVLGEIADARRSAPASVALAWLRTRGVVAIPGAKNRAQAEQNLASLDVELATAEREAIAAAAERCGV